MLLSRSRIRGASEDTALGQTAGHQPIRQRTNRRQVHMPAGEGLWPFLAFRPFANRLDLVDWQANARGARIQINQGCLSTRQWQWPQPTAWYEHDKLANSLKRAVQATESIRRDCAAGCYALPNEHRRARL